MGARHALRRNRRQRKTRYRKPRFQNRTRPEGWLPPSVKSRVDHIQTWLVRLFKLCNLKRICLELVCFDTHLMQNAEVSGVAYQQGELHGYEVRQYLLEKFDRKCCYCGKTGVPLQVEHITPKSRGGSDRVSNLCMACEPCNIKKNNRTAEEFGHPAVQALAKQPLKDAASINATRWAVWRVLNQTGIPIETSTGGRTKFNRVTQGYPKQHWIDAACVGAEGQHVKLDPSLKPLRIKAVGHGSRQMCQVNQYGNAIQYRSKNRSWKGWKTGDLATAIIPKGKYAGIHKLGRVTAKQRDAFKFTTATVGVFSVNCRYLTRVHRKDGYVYA